MVIGVPKEIKNNENRVALTPAGVAEFRRFGHTVYVQVNAGVESGFEDEEYIDAGAVMLPTIEDIYGISEMIMKVKEPIASEYNLIKEDQLLIVEGRVSNDDFSGGLRVNARKLYDLAAARSAYANMLKISCNGQADAAKLREMLAPYCRNGSGGEERRGCAIKVEYHNKDARVEVMLGEQWRVELRDELLSGLKTWLSEDNVKILYN